MPDEIDRWSAEHYYLQLAGIVRGQIEAGDLQPGQPLPSEQHMMDTFEVSRGTVRKALEVLREWGLIQTVPLRGSRVRPRGEWNPPAG